MVTQDGRTPICPTHAVRMIPTPGMWGLWHCPITEDGFQGIVCEHHATKNRGLWRITNHEDREWRHRFYTIRRVAIRNRLITIRSLNLKIAALLEIPRQETGNINAEQCKQVIAFLGRLEQQEQESC